MLVRQPKNVPLTIAPRRVVRRPTSKNSHASSECGAVAIITQISARHPSA